MIARSTFKVSILAVLGIFVASIANAEQVRILSGAHDGYSRLVVHMPARVPWTMSGGNDEREISFTTKPFQLDTSLVFDRITGERLSSVTPLADGVGLKIAMKCACDVDAFWLGQAMFVIDIRDPRPIENQDSETLDQERAKPPVPTSDGGPRSDPDEVGGAQSKATLLAAQHFTDQLENRSEAAPYQIDLGIARQSLAREIARAVSLGLVTARERPPLSQNVRPGHVDESPEPNIRLVADAINLNAVNSAGLPDLGGMNSGVQTAVGAACIETSDVAISAWGTDAQFASQIGTERRRLTDEFDRVTGDAAMDLARRYLYFGFGAEAIQVLNLVDGTMPEAKIAKAIAQIMEEGHTTSSVFSGQLECESDAALWSALSYEALPENTVVNIDAILRALSALPNHTRALLGPQLARKFTAVGQISFAKRILRVVDRNPADPSTDQVLAGAEIDISQHEPELADAALEAVVAANTEASAEALVRRIDNRLQTGRGVSQDMADLAGAYAQEQEGTKVGHDLARVYIQATAAVGDFDSAFSEMYRLFPGMPTQQQRHVTDTVLELLAVNADDVTFLRYANRMKKGADAGLSPNVGNMLGRRLLDLGFTGLAEIYLRPPTTGLDLENRLKLRAESNLKNGAPRQALVDLLGLTGTDVNVLREMAKSQLGEHRSAQLLFLSAGESEAALQEALLAEDWTQVKALADQELGNVVALGAADGMSDEPTGVLARNRALLDASALAREEVENLLQARALPVATGS
ncbi:hypothetical protein O4H61_10240 [Roseovarius aestuarii]|nr:hypothetical protein [Roseovarius aestuarii]